MKMDWTMRISSNFPWAKTHCSHPQHTIHQWMSYHGVLVFQYTEHTVPPKHWHAMAKKGSKGHKWAQFLHCCLVWTADYSEIFQTQILSHPIFVCPKTILTSLIQSVSGNSMNFKRCMQWRHNTTGAVTIRFETTAPARQYPQDMQRSPLMQNGFAVMSVVPSQAAQQPPQLISSALASHQRLHRLTWPKHTITTSAATWQTGCGVQQCSEMFGLRCHALTYYKYSRVHTVSCKLHWSKWIQMVWSDHIGISWAPSTCSRIQNMPKKQNIPDYSRDDISREFIRFPRSVAKVCRTLIHTHTIS